MQNLAALLRDRLRVVKQSKPKAPTGARSRLPPVLAEPLVGMATLELSHEPLSEQIRAFSDRAAASRYSAVRIMPLFLLPGVHVMEDIPHEVEQAQGHSRLPLHLCPYLGSHVRMAHTLAAHASTPDAKRLLLAHGSRYPNANDCVEALSHQLNSEAAYWAIAPSLESKITEFAHQGCHTVDILPYFLFRGTLTDAIAQQVEALQQQFPAMTLHLATPLGSMETLTDLVLDLMTHS